MAENFKVTLMVVTSVDLLFPQAGFDVVHLWGCGGL